CFSCSKRRENRGAFGQVLTAPAACQAVKEGEPTKKQGLSLRPTYCNVFLRIPTVAKWMPMVSSRARPRGQSLSQSLSLIPLPKKLRGKNALYRRGFHKPSGWIL